MPDTIDTKEVILDAAESLFGEHGIEGVSLRALTAKAQVNLAAVHYHFGSKEAVAKAAFLRCLRPINQERLAMLDAVEAAAGSGPLEVESVVTALYAPVIRFSEDTERRRCFMRLGARFYSEPAGYLETLFKEEFAEMAARFERAFARALPHLSAKELRCRVHFVVGVMVHTMLNPDRTSRWTDGALDLSDSQHMLEAMVRFATGGLRAPTTADSAVPAEVPDQVGLRV